MANNKIKKSLSLVLLAAMLTSTVACGGEVETEETETTAAPIVEDVPEAITPDMPEDLMFEGGVVRILGMENLVEGLNATEEEQVDMVKQELYDRNHRVEDRFGITFEFTNIGDWNKELRNVFRQSVNSGSNDYDVVFSVSTHQVELINEGLYLPLTDLPWINLEKPWWNKGYIEAVSFHADYPYVLFGNMTYNQVERTTCTFANVTKLEAQHNIVTQDLYDLVESGEWTLDKFNELVNLGYKDSNGDTKSNRGDMFGLVWETACMAPQFLAYGSGLTFTERDESGFPALALNNERSVDLTDKLVKLFCNNQAVLGGLTNNDHVVAFSSGEALFMVNRLFVAGWAQCREMKDDFVLLPIPKYDETIDGYHAVVEANVQWGCVSITAADEDLEMISAAMEQMCYDGYNTVTPLYYEQALKLKYSRGDADAQSKVIDIIVEGARTDYLFANDIGGVKAIFHKAVQTGQNNFASYYAERGGLAEYKLKQMISKFEENIYG